MFTAYTFQILALLADMVIEIQEQRLDDDVGEDEVLHAFLTFC